MIRARTAALLAALLVIPAAAIGADDDPALDVAKCIVKVKAPRAGATANHSVTLKARFAGDDLTASLDLFEEDLSISVGGSTVFELPPIAERKRLRKRSRFVWRFRDGRRARVQIDTLLGRLTLTTRKQDLTALRDAGADDVELVLNLGANTYRSTVSFDDRNDRWKYRADKAGQPVEPPVTPPVGNVSVVMLAQGDSSAIEDARTIVVRDDAAWADLWTEHTSNRIPPPARPTVDFTTDMVVAVWRGLQPSPANGLQHGGTNSDAFGYVVSHIETDTTGSCVFPTVVTQPYFILSVPRIVGSVRFDKLRAVEICHGNPGQ